MAVLIKRCSFIKLKEKIVCFFTLSFDLLKVKTSAKLVMLNCILHSNNKQPTIQN
ncbi:hypothetical protein T190115A13A_110003 [Tenacibaculum sp. 190524A02b]|uniref:Uncharacterized protein n=1 Tax=Tenacibaculum vairaonense TaxID=3137860 RepID=A0ABP1F926_9FLAO